MKFKTKIVAVSTVVLFLSLTFLSVAQYFQVKNSVEHLVNESMEEVSIELASGVSKIIDKKRILTKLLISLVEDDLDAESIENIYSKPIIKQEFVLAGVGFEHNGVILDNDINWVPGSDYDPRKRPWYIAAKQKNKLIITAPYADAVTKDMIVSIAGPIKNDGQFAGALFVDVSLSGLGDVLKKFNPLQAGYAFLISNDGNFISHPNSAQNGQSSAKYFGAEIKPLNKLQYFTVNDQKLVFKFVKVPTLDWYLGVALDQGAIGTTSNSLRTQAIIYSVIALIIGLFVIIFTVGKLMRPLEELGNVMNDIANGDGDLTQRLATDGDDEFAKLANGFNGFVSKLQLLISDSKSLSNQITAGTEETAVSAKKSSDAIVEQLSELELLATAMTEMSSTSLEVAGFAQQAAQYAETADGAVDSGAKVVDLTSQSIEQLSTYIENAVVEVQQLEESTGNIETILQVISGIAEQTNLLALNAAIEAARAGEQGRGFAVVADEVRNLAQRTQESTSQIKSMIDILQTSSRSVAAVMTQSRDEAVLCVEKGKQAIGSLEHISGSISQITEMNFQIATAAEEQSLVAEEINVNTIKIKGYSEDVNEYATLTNESMEQQQKITSDQQKVLNRFIV
ncbi:MAG: methyl-accepting chemotaxis protein [Gammaproteobacteria bacterium]|nr:methyl-accepting chemotaxis protein [Gammaproteobacteria bacterium]